MKRPSRRVPRGDRGDTLVELLATVMIMGIAVAVILGAVATTLRITDMHRKQSVAGAAVREFAEKIETSVAATPTSGYKACAGIGDYQSLYTAPTGYQREVVSVTYWNADPDPANAKFVTTCGTDTGVQRVSLRVWSADNRAEETLDVIIRKPCRPADATC
jgi:type II secretory pathway pseudopilin PulG